MSDTPAEPSAASQLLQQHAASHHVTVEDAEDEDLKSPTTAEPAAKAEPVPAKAAAKPKAPAFDTKSHELFPELGGPKPKANAGAVPVWSAKAQANGKANGASPANGTPRTSAPASGVTTPTGPALHGLPSVSLPGRNVETLYLEPQHILPRNQLKRPLNQLIQDLNKRSRANINMSTLGSGKIKFEASGPQEAALQALKDLVNQVGTKQSIKVPIPQSARAHIIGKGGSTIKSLQEKSGARIQLPKVEEGQPPADDDDDDEGLIDVLVEGNAYSAAAARDLILKIAGERVANVNTKLKGIPAEFYPFIAGPKNTHVHKLEEDKGVQIRVPPFQARCEHPPNMPAKGERPVFAPAPVENTIQLAGDRAAVKAARAEIERQVEELRRQLAIEQLSIQRGRHQFLVGDMGIPMDQFFEDTGCALILPNDEEDDTVTIIGPPDAVSDAVDRVMDLAMNMQCSNIDVSRFYRNLGGGAAAHAQNITRYLRQRKEIERLEKLYNVHFNTPFNGNNALPWEVFSRDGKNAIRAQSEVKGLIESHPPSRMAAVPIDPFFHHYIRNEVQPRVRQDYRVHLVVPEASEAESPVLLVYEGPSSPDSYEIPRNQPSAAEAQEMQRFLNEATKYLNDLISQQESLASDSIDVPQKYHEKLRRFIKREQQENRHPNQIPVRVSSVGTRVNFRGPQSAVESLAAKCKAFIEQEKEDEKERGFTLEFPFPQKFANHLIGKGGSNIRDLREKFDVDIQVQDGKVELKGPKAKAEVAKAHILSLGRQLEDETTFQLKVDPKFHRELIGAQGAQINRLQTRYKVLIFFPRTGKAVKDDESVAEASDAGKPRRQQAPDEVIIRGPKRGAEAARDELLSLLQYLKDNSYTATVSVQQKQVPSLIGSGGAVLDQLRQATGAKIDIPSARDTEDGLIEIQIKGGKQQVEAAKKALEEKKKVFEDTVVKTIEVDKKYHKSLIGAGGSTLRDIVVKAGGSDDRRELARTIQFPKQDSDGNTIKVEGRTEVVDKIIAQIEAIVSERQNQVTEVIDVPQEKHRSLIGRGGDIKRGLESQFKVSIDIPRQGSGQTGVKIVGQSADVQKAKSHIESLVKEQQGETVQIPRALHHSIANNGLFFRKLKSDTQVSVDHAGHSLPPKPTAPAAPARANGGALPLITDESQESADAHVWNVVEQSPSAEEGDIPWVLRGSPENIEKAKKAIEAALEQAKKQTATGYLILPDPRTHRYVIGQGGSKVNSIRKQSGCKITVPRDSDKGEAIEVIGTKEGVEKAKELILAAVQEGQRNANNRSPRE
ncbi:hypothetical protein QBC37DRAFT_302829 [Rhypophila decipiens]|uniref:K Homology domain-containing protein n=1 Tax=Rhypophila decipiens TaxID=261697 RepID=A0AAN7BDH3_9PEZI|nr:hypothetical protein QBC37DRAFT_302829 [Rhypophila decipiens]